MASPSPTYHTELRWIHQVPLTTQSYGDLDPEDETIYQHSRLSSGCIEHELKPQNHCQWVSGTFQIFNFLLPKASSLTHIRRFTWPFLKHKKILDVSEECGEKKEFTWALHSIVTWDGNLWASCARTVSWITSKSCFCRSKQAPAHCQMSLTLTPHTGAVKTESERMGLGSSRARRTL
jgi:hypothetical protein